MSKAMHHHSDEYQPTVDWLFSQTAVFQRDGASAYKPGLDTIKSLCAWCGNPQEQLRCVHIAGTNGKGSTASTLAAIFQASGLKTGLYTSPHLVDFRERIRIDGAMIPADEVVGFVNAFRASASRLQPSFFELTTAMAFSWFARQRVDIAVIETGLGGRLDSTNVITPQLSIITNISLDHTALLGTSPADIAREKAGIIKPGVPVVIGEADNPQVRRVFDETAAALGSPIIYAPPVRAERLADGTWLYPNYGIHGALRGEFQPQNAATVLEAVKFFPEVTAEGVKTGFERVESLTGLRGRLTEYCREPVRVVYDTGHNPGAWRYLSRELERMERPLTVVCGFAADKDVSAILDMMPKGARYIFCRPSGNRGMAADELQRLAASKGLSGEAIADVKAAAARAIASTRRGGTVFIGGSNFVIADFLR